MHLQDVVYSLRQFGELIKTERRNLFNRTNDTIFENIENIFKHISEFGFSYNLVRRT